MLQILKLERSLLWRRLTGSYANEFPTEVARSRETLKEINHRIQTAPARKPLDEIRKKKRKKKKAVRKSPCRIVSYLGLHQTWKHKWNWTFSMLKDLITKKKKDDQIYSMSHLTRWLPRASASDNPEVKDITMPPKHLKI